MQPVSDRERAKALAEKEKTEQPVGQRCSKLLHDDPECSG